MTSPASHSSLARRKLLSATLPWVAPWAVLLVLWQGVRFSGLVNAALVPGPGDVLLKWWELFAESGFLTDLAMSAYRVVVGVLLGVAVAVPAGFLVGYYAPVRRMTEPAINFFRALPPIALIPLVIVYFGIGEPAKIVILFYASFFAGVVVIREGIAQLNPLHVRVARTLGANEREIFWRVVVPSSVPHILTALRVALGVAWATLVASELIAAQQGLGAVIQDASSFFQLEIIYAGIATIGLTALVMDWLLRRLSRRLVSWQESAPS